MEHQRPARLRAVTMLLSALVVVAAACGGSDDDGEESAGAATTTIDVEVDDTTTSTLPATTTTLSEADRFRTIAVELWNARNDLYQNPPADPGAALAEIFHPQCSCYEDELIALQSLIDQGGRIDGPPSVPVGVRADLTSSTADSFAVAMALESGPRRLLAPDGSVIRELAGSEPIAITLVVSVYDGRRLVDGAVVLEVDAAYVADLTAEGLP